MWWPISTGWASATVRPWPDGRGPPGRTARVILTSTKLSHWFPAGSTMAGLPLIKKPFSQEDLDRFLAPVAVTAIPGS